MRHSRPGRGKVSITCRGRSRCAEFRHHLDQGVAAGATGIGGRLGLGTMVLTNRRLVKSESWAVGVLAIARRGAAGDEHASQAQRTLAGDRRRRWWLHGAIPWNTGPHHRRHQSVRAANKGNAHATSWRAIDAQDKKPAPRRAGMGWRIRPRRFAGPVPPRRNHRPGSASAPIRARRPTCSARP